MRARSVRTAILIACLILGRGAYASDARVGAQGVTVYVNKVVTAPQGDVSLGSLVRPSGPLSAVAQEALARSVTVLRSGVQLIPAAAYQEWIEHVFGTDAIIVGSRTVLIPKGSPAEGEPYLLDRLADYLVAQKLVGDGPVEMTFTQGSLAGTPPQDGSPSFQVTRSSRGVEVAFLLVGAGGGSVSGRVALPAVDPSAAAQAGVSSGTPVRVVFHKGPITVEVPGKALAAASAGDNVDVSITESRKTFNGRVIDAKVVQVDLP
jgi:Chaperone for flagella basal body P-ring formation